ncbi:MAG TPA: Flp pilus assembly protein CpaB [Acidimicrobiales bacterium]|nr:Flp pilus assembly protein CpaB [Acidimicrobiales bacterium]
MTPKRTIVVAVAVAVGVAASVLSYVFLNNAQERAYHNAKLVEAYVVVKPVPATLNGTEAIDNGYIQHKKIPQEFRPTSAVTKISSIEGKEAVAPFAVGQVLVSSMFASSSSASNSFARAIPSGHVAVTASVDQTHGVADFPGPGDKVDLMVSLNGTETLLLQNVQIIAVGQTTVTATASVAAGQSTTAASTPTNTSGLYTFSVTPTDAERIALAEQEGLGLYMTLVPPNSPQVTIPSVNQGNINSAQ